VFTFPDVFHLLPNKFPCLRRWGFACSLRLAGALDSLILWHNLISPQLRLPVVFLSRNTRSGLFASFRFLRRSRDTRQSSKELDQSRNQAAGENEVGNTASHIVLGPIHQT
jgi:hypothetical protein